MILLVPTLSKLDGVQITDDERLAAVDLRQQREDAAAAAEAAENADE